MVNQYNSGEFIAVRSLRHFDIRGVSAKMIRTPKLTSGRIEPKDLVEEHSPKPQTNTIRPIRYKNAATD